MATMTITIPNDQVAAVVEAFAVKYKYQDDVLTVVSGIETYVPNPESKNQFAKRMVREYVKNIYVSHQIDLANAALISTRSTAYTTVSGVDVT